MGSRSSPDKGLVGRPPAAIGLRFIRGRAAFVDGFFARLPMLTWSPRWESRSVRKRLPSLVAMLVFVTLAPQLVTEALLRQVCRPPVLLSLSFQLGVAATTITLAILYGWFIARLVDIRRMFQNNAAVLRTGAPRSGGAARRRELALGAVVPSNELGLPTP